MSLIVTRVGTSSEVESSGSVLVVEVVRNNGQRVNLVHRDRRGYCMSFPLTATDACRVVNAASPASYQHVVRPKERNGDTKQ